MDSGGGLLSVLFWSQQPGAVLHVGKRVCAGQPHSFLQEKMLLALAQCTGGKG